MTVAGTAWGHVHLRVVICVKQTQQEQPGTEQGHSTHLALAHFQQNVDACWVFEKAVEANDLFVCQ
jgi:hypothetical protein